MSESNKNKCIVLSKETTKRLVKDVKDLIKSPLDNEGVYYKHDDTNILMGYAYICGPKDSVYFGGNYFFEFIFPQDYPHSPPSVIFLNKGGISGNTRIHPNMYRTGKICLSILNTWAGEQWSGCQSIRSILLTILSIMDNKPLLHEPGFTLTHKDFNPYNRIVIYKNLEEYVCNILQNKSLYLNKYIDIFKEEINNQLNKNKELLFNIIQRLQIKHPKSYVEKTIIYNMNILIDWNNVYNEFNKIII